jgi:hypothetical protein
MYEESETGTKFGQSKTLVHFVTMSVGSLD